MADLLDDDFRLAAKDTLSRRHDHLLGNREGLFAHLKDRWTGLSGARYDILLYGLPIGYEVMRGNTSDKTTLRGMLEKCARPIHPSGISSARRKVA